MRVMVVVKASKESEAGAAPDPKIMEEMGKFNEELVKAGVMLAGEGLRAGLGVVDHVGRQEQHRRAEGGDHHRAVLRHATAADQDVADRQQDEAGRVERGVEGREIRESHRARRPPHSGCGSNVTPG